MVRSSSLCIVNLSFIVTYSLIGYEIKQAQSSNHCIKNKGSKLQIYFRSLRFRSSLLHLVRLFIHLTEWEISVCFKLDITTVSHGFTASFFHIYSTHTPYLFWYGKLTIRVVSHNFRQGCAHLSLFQSPGIIGLTMVKKKVWNC